MKIKKKKKWGAMVPLMLGMFVKKAETNLYPAIHANVAENFRGMIAFKADLCVGCGLCQKVCPTKAIEIEKEKIDQKEKTDQEEKSDQKEQKRFTAVIFLDKCIFCGQCADTCRKGALCNTSDFELACKNKNALTVRL